MICLERGSALRCGSLHCNGYGNRGILHMQSLIGEAAANAACCVEGD